MAISKTGCIRRPVLMVGLLIVTAVPLFPRFSRCCSPMASAEIIPQIWPVTFPQVTLHYYKAVVPGILLLKAVSFRHVVCK